MIFWVPKGNYSMTDEKKALGKFWKRSRTKPKDQCTISKLGTGSLKWLMLWRLFFSQQACPFLNWAFNRCRTGRHPWAPLKRLWTKHKFRGGSIDHVLCVLVMQRHCRFLRRFYLNFLFFCKAVRLCDGGLIALRVHYVQVFPMFGASYHCNRSCMKMPSFVNCTKNRMHII